MSSSKIRLGIIDMGGISRRHLHNSMRLTDQIEFHPYEPVAELCRRQALINELVVRAIVEEDRKLAQEAFAIDPMIDDLEVAKKLLDDYLEAFDSYLSFKL